MLPFSSAIWPLMYIMLWEVGHRFAASWVHAVASAGFDMPMYTSAVGANRHPERGKVADCLKAALIGVKPCQNGVASHRKNNRIYGTLVSRRRKQRGVRSEAFITSMMKTERYRQSRREEMNSPAIGPLIG